MIEYGILFCFVVLFILVGIYILENKGSRSAIDFFLETRAKVNSINSDVLILTGAVNNTAAVAGSNEKRTTEILNRVANLEKEADDTELLCEKLRQSQNRFDERLSRKRPIVRVPTGPIQVEVLPGAPRTTPIKQQNLGRGMKAILKDAK